LYVSAVSDTQIIELDEPEPAATHVPWRPGSLTIAAAPLVVVALVVSLVVPQLADKATAKPQPTAGPEPTPGGGWLTTPGPQATFLGTTPFVVTPLGGASGESGVAEVLGGQRWVGLGPSYPARGDVAEAVLNGAAYVIGGTGTTEDGRHVYRYDPVTGIREPAPDLPVSLDHAMAATLNDRIYVFGGFVFGRPTDRVFSLGANDARWIEHSAMPVARAAGGAAVVGDRIYIVGGVTENGSWVRDVWVYERGKLITGFAPIPTARDHLAVGSYQGRVCAAGGNGGERAFECYDPMRNEWKVMPDLRKPAIGGSAVEAAGWFWVVYASDVHVFTIDHWHFGPRPQSPRAGHALVVIDGALYLIENGLGAYAPMEVLRPKP
jgi:hypothetical protein